MAGTSSLQPRLLTRALGYHAHKWPLTVPETEHFPLILRRKESLGWQLSKKGSPFWQICSLKGQPLPSPALFPVPGPSPRSGSPSARPGCGTSLHFPPRFLCCPPSPAALPAAALLWPPPGSGSTVPLRIQPSWVERKETKNKPAPPLPVKTRPEKSPGQPPSQPAAAPAALGSLPCSSRSRPAGLSLSGSAEPPARAGAACGQGWGRRGSAVAQVGLGSRWAAEFLRPERLLHHHSPAQKEIK